MERPYLIYRNGLLFTKTLTNAKAVKIAQQLQSQGFKASVVREFNAATKGA
jgi:uncharacterized protein YcgL (UPF0745 family)